MSTTATEPPPPKGVEKKGEREVSPVVLLLGVLLVVVMEFVSALLAPLKCNRFSSPAKGKLMSLYPVEVSPSVLGS